MYSGLVAWQLRSIEAMPSSETIRRLAETCSGDIRSAVNTLQFACLTSDPSWERAAASDNSVKKRARKKTTLKSASCMASNLASASLDGIGGRESTLQLFHALGKILCSKRKAVWAFGALQSNAPTAI